MFRSIRLKRSFTLLVSLALLTFIFCTADPALSASAGQSETPFLVSAPSEGSKTETDAETPAGETGTPGDTEAPADENEVPSGENTPSDENEVPGDITPPVDENITPVDISTIVIEESKLVIKPGKKHLLKISGVDGLEVKWKSSNTDIATVSKKGRVTAVADGKTYVTASVKAPVAKEDGTGIEYTVVKLKCKVVVESPKTVNIAGVGDLLFHDRVIASGKRSDGSYNYDAIFKATKDHFAKFDVVIANQETPFTDNPAKYKGYPAFGTPRALGDAMIKAGINVVLSASNHSWDQQANGIKVTTEYWKKHKDEAIQLGMSYTEKEFKTVVYKKYNGIKIAFINFTNFLNSASGMKKYYVNVLNARQYNDYGNSYGNISEERLFKDIATAHEKADFVIVLPHWGTEYTHVPTSAQKKLAQKMADAGADAIIGTHAHVVMPMKILKASDGRKVPCYYSTGNFVSNMGQAVRNLEGIAELKITKWNGQTTINNAEFVPLINHIDRADRNFCVYLLSDYTDELAQGHLSNNSSYGGAGTLTPKKMQKLFDSIGNDKWK